MKVNQKRIKTERSKERDTALFVPEYIRLNRKPSFTEPDNTHDDTERNKIPLNTGGVIDNQWLAFDGKVEQDNSEYSAVQEDETINDTASSSSVKTGEYILMVSATVICSGDLATVTEKINDIVYGNDPEFSDHELNPEDFVVLKRMHLSFGISIDNG